MLGVKSPEDQLRDLYYFFVNAEINNEEVMYSQIQERLVDRNDNEIYWYANNFWTWFLRKQGMRGQYRIFDCRGIRKYPVEYFVWAHQKGQGKHFYTFGSALVDSKERARERKRLREQGNKSHLDILESTDQPSEIGQDYPEEISFANNEAEETEEEELSASESSSSSEPGPGPEPEMEEKSTPGASEIVSSPSMIERIAHMFGLSKKDRDLLEQLLHAQGELHTQIQELQSQQAMLSPETLEQLRKDVAQEIQKEQETFRAEVIGKINDLAEEIHKTPQPNFSSIYANIESQVRAITGAIERLPVSPDIAEIGEVVEKSLKKTLLEITQGLQAISPLVATLKEQIDSPAWLPATTNELAAIQKLVEALEGRFAQRASAILLDGEFTPELVDKATKKANGVIEDALADVQDIVKELKDACITWSNHAHQSLQSVGMDRVEKKKRWLQNHEEQEKQWQQNHEKKKREWLQDEEEEDQHLETVMGLFSNGRQKELDPSPGGMV